MKPVPKVPVTAAEKADAAVQLRSPLQARIERAQQAHSKAVQAAAKPKGPSHPAQGKKPASRAARKPRKGRS